MDLRNVQALVARFSLKDKRQRGAALAGPYVHGAMCLGMRTHCVSHGACVCSLSVETWLATIKRAR